MYSGLQYGHIVYEGYLPGAPSATGGDGDVVRSNIKDLKEVGGRLGCGEPSFFITSRCAGTVTCVLNNEIVTNAQWDRRLDDVSMAEVEINLTGDTEFTCCECLAEAEPWCHELHIWRDGDEVWVGPIEEIEYEYPKVTVRAKDSLNWLSVRVPAVDINFVGTGTDLTDIAEFLINVALAEDSPEFTCEINNIFAQPTGFTFDVFQAKFDQTAIENLRDLADAGLDFTTLGRTIVLIGDTAPLTPLVLLNDEHIMSGGITIKKDGKAQGNRYYVHFDGDEGIPAMGEAVEKYCYGAIERIRDADMLSNGADAGDVADIYVAASDIAPRTIEMTPGARLSPNTPWTINEMVPGARVDVAITKFCLNLTQSFRLTGVQVSYNPTDGESVGITVIPINSTPV